MPNEYFLYEKEINKDAKFVVFHDAYQYFEERFGVRAAGALTLNTDVLPGAKQIADIQDVMKQFEREVQLSIFRNHLNQ